MDMESTSGLGKFWEQMAGRLPLWLPDCFWLLCALLAVVGQAFPTEYKPTGHALTAVLLGTIGLLFPLLLIQARRRSLRFSPWFWIAPSAFLAWVVLDLGVHGFRSAQPWTWQAWFTGVVLFWEGCVAIRLSRQETARRYLLFLVLLGGLQGFVGLLQFHDPQRFITPFLTPNGYEGVRVVGTLDNPNQYGSLLVLLLPIAMGGLIGHLGRFIFIRFCSAACLLLMLSGLVVSQSRGALVALVVGCLVWILLSGFPRSSLRWVGWGGLVAVCLAAVFLVFQFSRNLFPAFVGSCMTSYLQQVHAGNREATPGLSRYSDLNGDGCVDARDLVVASHEKFSVSADKVPERSVSNPIGQFAGRLVSLAGHLDANDGSRLLSSLALFNMWKDNSVLGIGPGNYKVCIGDYVLCPENGMIVFTHGHNLPLQLLSELGIPGLAGFLLTLILLVRWARQRISASCPISSIFWCGMGLFILWANQFLDISVWYLPFKYVVPFLFGFLAVTGAETNGTDKAFGDGEVLQKEDSPVS